MKKLLGEGYFSQVLQYGEDKVIKLMRKGWPLELVEREFSVAQEVHRHYRYSPAVYEIVRVDDRYGIVYERAEGRPVSDYIIISVWKTKRLIKTMVDYHIKLHSLTSEKLPSYEDIVNENLNKIDWLTDSQKAFIKHYVSGLPHKNCICHGDYHPDNVIMENGLITVIDWTTAFRGNPLSDVVNMKILCVCL